MSTTTYANLMKVLDAKRMAEKAEHDRTRKHQWIEVSTYSDKRRRFLCCYCDATKVEPWEAEAS